jgi:diketogulonate reductase-like aldo/keto reductase/L-ascorbate metabolism protein UlaG (beta-lactamase superfamily)
MNVTTARVALNNGTSLPRVGLGVFQAPPGEAKRAVLAALRAGYRHVDTARIYGNEGDVGAALRESGIGRDEVFVTTKLWNADQGYDAALRAFDRSLERLGLEQVDLYLLHWPVPGKRLESWRALERLASEGRARAVGVSNFMPRHLEELFAHAKLPPAVNQIEASPFLQQRDTRALCARHGIVVEAYSPLTKGQRLGHPVLVEVARSLGRSPAQVLLRWGLERDMVVLPKSTKEARIAENAALFDFELGPEHAARLDALEEGLVTGWDPRDAPLPFARVPPGDGPPGAIDSLGRSCQICLMIELAGLRLERARASKQFREGRFHNPTAASPSLKGPKLPIMGEFLFGGRSRRPPAPIPVESPLAAWAKPASSGLRVTWLGHSTLLLEVDGRRVLTDPVFGPRVSPVSFAGTKRFHPVPATIAELPPLDAILLSHDHYDHLCAPSMRELARLRVPVVTSLGVGARLEGFGVDPALITELDWWEGYTLPGGDLAFTATPAQHFSGRSLGDRNATLWSSWAIRTANRRLFFSGDTGLTDEFTTVRERLGPFDLVMLEIGAWHPSWGDIHLGPANALRAFEMLGGGALLPVHWGTFDLALHPWSEPAETLLSLAQPAGARVLTPLLGRPFEPAHVEGPTPWWRAVQPEGASPNEPRGATHAAGALARRRRRPGAAIERRPAPPAGVLAHQARPRPGLHQRLERRLRARRLDGDAHRRRALDQIFGLFEARPPERVLAHRLDDGDLVRADRLHLDRRVPHRPRPARHRAGGRRRAGGRPGRAAIQAGGGRRRDRGAAVSTLGHQT